ncbi:HNH endonuclease signature motif containing protein [Nocardia sp. NPDC056100]|uniref:HNH endonuclease signature motif containing protein n=1 Tax=Nocardia sp. NPDC056100 TaxID=3345712 RepID=UPI0035E1D486
MGKRNVEPGRSEMLADRKARRDARREAEGLPALQTMSKGAKRRERQEARAAQRVAQGLPPTKPRSVYETYIASSWWVNRRRDYFTKHEKKCSGCGGREGISLHHKTYARKGAELDSDLVPVCQPCHTGIGAYHKAKQSGSLASNTDIVLAHVRTTGEPGAHPLETPEQCERRRKKAASKASPGTKARRSARGMKYDVYIASDAWAQRRREYFAAHERKCAGCGTILDITLHHRTYARSGAGRELDADLSPVCRACHSAIHLYHKLKLGRLEDATDTVLAYIRTTELAGSYPEIKQQRRVRNKRRNSKARLAAAGES